MKPEAMTGKIPNGFSLLELLIVIAIIVILTTLYWGSGSKTRARNLKIGCQENLKKIYIALEIFSNEHDTKFPEVPGARTSSEPLDLLVPRYTSDTAIFICSASKDSIRSSSQSLRMQKISYAYYMGRSSRDPNKPLMSDRQVDTRAKAAGQQVFSVSGKAPGNNHGVNGGNILFCDGDVRQSAPNASVTLDLSQGVSLLNPE
jgi:prepilin-type N-terminal cleavage/methylation domain-containing protein/prepilin-type processing-associated H-X9-DG protein